MQLRGSLLDNRWGIPYNPNLLAKYDCQINVKVCSIVKAVKHLYKHVYKGHDCNTVAFTSSDNADAIDEITQYINQVDGPFKAVWRILKFH